MTFESALLTNGEPTPHTSLQTRIYSVIQTWRSEFPAEEVVSFGDFSQSKTSKDKTRLCFRGKLDISS